MKIEFRKSATFWFNFILFWSKWLRYLWEKMKPSLCFFPCILFRVLFTPFEKKNIFFSVHMINFENFFEKENWKWFGDYYFKTFLSYSTSKKISYNTLREEILTGRNFGNEPIPQIWQNFFGNLIKFLNLTGINIGKQLIFCWIF